MIFSAIKQDGKVDENPIKERIEEVVDAKVVVAER